MKEKQKIKKSNSKGIILLIAIIIIAIIVVGTIIYQNNKNTQQEQQQETEQDSLSLIDMNNTENAKIESGVKENTSENISKDRKLGNLSITDIKLSAQDGVTSFTATVKNDSNKDFAGGIVKISFTNKDGSNYAELEAYIPEIVAGGTNAINAGTTADIANAYDFTMELEK
jgi:cytoskeletal protein RodZ